MNVSIIEMTKRLKAENMDIILIILNNTNVNLPSNTFHPYHLSKIYVYWDRAQFHLVPLPFILKKENLKEHGWFLTFQSTVLCDTFLSIGF